jgi:pantoate kinase
VLSDRNIRDKINRSGKIALRNLLFSPSVDALMKESRDFTEKSELASEEVKRAMKSGDSIENTSMVMIGNSVFSVIDGEDIDRRAQELCDIWSEYGKVTSCDVDTFGARPIY